MKKIGPYTFEPAGLDAITTDTLLLADFIPPLAPSDSVLDIGTGSGALPLLLASRHKECQITGVEIQKERAGAAMRAVISNGLRERISILNKDYRSLGGVFPCGAFTHIIANPPFIKAGAGRVSPFKGRRVARSEVYGEVADLVRAAAYLMSDSGRFFLIFTAVRFKELLRELRDNALSPLRLRFIHTKKGAPASRVLVEAAKDSDGRKRAPMVEAPIVLGGKK